MTFYFPNKPIMVYNPAKIVATLQAGTGDWIVQPKWNGKRVAIECLPTKGKGCEVKLYSREGSEWYAETTAWQWLKTLPIPRPWYLDGELLRDGRIYVWDFAVLKGQPVYNTAYGPRLKCLQGMLPSPVVVEGKRIEVVETLPAASYEALLARKGSDLLEGLVWKELGAKNLWGPKATTNVASQFKYRF